MIDDVVPINYSKNVAPFVSSAEKLQNKRGVYFKNWSTPMGWYFRNKLSKRRTDIASYRSTLEQVMTTTDRSQCLYLIDLFC